MFMVSLESMGISGIKIGHVTDLVNATGCTVVLSERGAVGGVCLLYTSDAADE